jgi:lipoprotein signal peptidase
VAIILLVVADLALKSWAFSAVGLHNTNPLSGNWLAVRCITNPGGVWGMGQEYTSVLTGVRVIAVGLMIWLIGRQSPDNKRGLVVLAMLIAGASGNLYDNLSAWLPWAGNGEVRDFVQVYFAEPGWWPSWPGWPFAPWPIFNLADALIVTGFVSLITGLAHLHIHPEPVAEDSAPEDPEAADFEPADE